MRGSDECPSLTLSSANGNSLVFPCGELCRVHDLIPREKSFFITDRNVYSLYSVHFPGDRVVVLNPGEEGKRLETVRKIYLDMISASVDRSWTVIGVGGGIVCDIAGFVAATFMRGLDFGFVASTLLAQVDAAIGGKNGVNLDGYKNMVGVFCQPRFVICDQKMLLTLPHSEWTNGLAEALKYGLILEKKLLEDLQKLRLPVQKGQLPLVSRIVQACVRLKVDVVSRDERERGERKKLNFGHTLAHALEKTVGIPHGSAVGMGMGWAARLSHRKGLISSGELKEIQTLLKGLRLPSRVEVSPHQIISAILRDKKRRGNAVDMVLLNGIGRSVISEIPLPDLEEAIHDLR